jgi:hypothetical protein
MSEFRRFLDQGNLILAYVYSVKLNEKFSHFTVIKGHEGVNFTLFDSYGQKYLVGNGANFKFGANDVKVVAAWRIPPQ